MYWCMFFLLSVCSHKMLHKDPTQGILWGGGVFVFVNNQYESEATQSETRAQLPEARKNVKT